MGIAIASILGFLLANKRGIELFDFLAAIAYVLLGVLIGAKVLFLIVSWKEIVRLQLTFLEVMKGGFVFYGGLIGGGCALAVYCKQYKLNFYEYADIIVTPLPLGHAFGRCGCLLAGCCYGIEYDGIGCVIYRSAHNFNTPLGVRLLPVQFIEAILLLCLFIILLICLQKKKEGLCFFVYLQSYAFMRFFLEFFRGDTERGFLFLLSTSQWISVMIILIAIIVERKKYKRKKASCGDEKLKR